MKQAVHQMTDTEAKHIAFLDKVNRVKIDKDKWVGDMEAEMLSDRYFCLNDAETLYKIDLAAYDQLDRRNNSRTTLFHQLLARR